MSRRALAGLAVAVLATVAPARATPTAVVRRFAETTLDVTGRDGVRYDIVIDAYGPSLVDDRPAVLEVEIRRCPASCTTVLRSRTVVPPTALSVAGDYRSAVVLAMLRGQLLSVRFTWAWGNGIGGLSVTSEDDVRTMPFFNGAYAQVHAFGLYCRTLGGVGLESRAAPLTDPYVRYDSGSVPAALHALHGARCPAEAAL